MSPSLALEKIARCASVPLRDEEAFARISAGWRDWGFRLALKVTGCPEAAADALQEALLRAYRSRNGLQDLDAADAWFRRILVRCAIGQRPRRAPLSPSKQEGATSDLDESLHVRLTLGRLRPHHRAILALAVGEDLSYAEIAALLDIPEGTVGSRLSAAREAFRKAWEDEG